MKPTIILVATLLHAPLASLHAADDLKSTNDAPWPPAHMRALPTDYQDRLRGALEAQLESDKKLTRDANPVLWVRFGIAGLALGRQVERINHYIEEDTFKYQPSDKFGFSLFSLPYVRLYGLFNDRSGVMKGRLSSKAQANLEKTLWDCAKANSKLAEAQRGVWDMDGSENHHVTSKVSDFLVAQFIKDIPAYADLKYDDGSTPGQQYEARLAYWSQWIDSRVRRGLFMEDGGSSYQNYTIEALINLSDFASDTMLRRKADMFLDLVFANIAEETLGVQRSGPKTRTKEESFRDRVYDLLFDSPGDTFDLSNYQLATSDYYPAPAIVALAKEFQNRGTYTFAKTAPGAVAISSTENKTSPEIEERSKWRTMDKNNLMVRNGFGTAHYIMGSHGLDTSAKTDPYRVQRWQGLVFANDPTACIGMDGKSGATKGGYISNPFKTIQDRNVMVTMKWGPDIDRKTDPHLWIYLSGALDAVEEAEGWIFVQSGAAYAAIRIVEGGYHWSRPWQHSATFSVNEKSYVTPTSADTPIILVANDANDYNHDFAAFKRALIAQPIGWKDGILSFATITHEGALKPGKVTGMTVNLKPSRVNDSPFIRSEADSGVVYVRKGDETLKLDFSDPQNPVKTVGLPVAPMFPPGMGQTRPITFGTTK